MKPDTESTEPDSEETEGTAEAAITSETNNLTYDVRGTLGAL